MAYHISRMRRTKVGIIDFDNGSMNSKGRLSTRKRITASRSTKRDFIVRSAIPSPRERRFYSTSVGTIILVGSMDLPVESGL
jgi:hypothetical protein